MQIRVRTNTTKSDRGGTKRYRFYPNCRSETFCFWLQDQIRMRPAVSVGSGFESGFGLNPGLDSNKDRYIHPKTSKSNNLFHHRYLNKNNNVHIFNSVGRVSGGGGRGRSGFYTDENPDCIPLHKILK
jgi:hypothetical protein